jgi:hypothetical protein
MGGEGLGELIGGWGEGGGNKKSDRTVNKCCSYLFDSVDFFSFQTKFRTFLAVFRIRDNLVRIRIHGSVPLTDGSGSCSFRQ